MRALAAALLFAVAAQPARPRVEVLRSTGGLPAHIAGAFQPVDAFSRSSVTCAP